MDTSQSAAPGRTQMHYIAPIEVVIAQTQPSSASFYAQGVFAVFCFSLTDIKSTSAWNGSGNFCFSYKLALASVFMNP